MKVEYIDFMTNKVVFFHPLFHNLEMWKVLVIPVLKVILLSKIFVNFDPKRHVIVATRTLMNVNF